MTFFFFFPFWLLPEGAVFCTFSLCLCLKSINKDEFKRAGCAWKLSHSHLKSRIQLLFSPLWKEALAPKMMLRPRCMKSGHGLSSSAAVLFVLPCFAWRSAERGIFKALWKVNRLEQLGSSALYLGVLRWFLFFLCCPFFFCSCAVPTPHSPISLPFSQPEVT